MIVLVGERFNAPRVPRWDALDDAGWLRIAMRAGAFREGPGRKKLLSLGLEWDVAMNLLPPSPTPGEWDSDRASRIAMLLLEKLEQDDEVIMAGRRVATAFGCEDLPFGADLSGFVAAPHPSGRSHWWNSAERVEAFRRLRRKT